MTENEIRLPRVMLWKNPLEFPKIVKNPAPYFKNLLDENGGAAEVMMTNRYALMTDRADLIRHVLQKNHKNYIKTSIVRDILSKQTGMGLLTSDGDYWLKQRRAIQPGFHRKRLQGISEVMIDEIQSYMEDKFDQLAASEEVVDLYKEMLYLAFRVVSKSLFGEHVNENELEVIDETVSNGQQIVVDEIRKPFIKPWLYLSGAYAKNKRLRGKSDELILDIIRDRQKSKAKHNDLLDMLLETEYEDGTKMTEQQLLNEALILYVAGHETSAVAMSWIWYMLGQHPDVEEKLYQNVMDVLGTDRNPSFEGLRELGYPLQVIEETMRLYPPAWIVDREPLEDDNYNGIPIKKGRDVICLIYGVHRNPKYWENPEVFNPERFTPENKKKQEPYSYIPFGGGPRLCIGNNFALMEMQFALSMMIRRYKIEIIKDQEVDINPLITLRPRYGLKAIIRKR